MVNDSKYIYISGLISLSFFSLIVTLFVYMILMQERIKTFAMKKDTFVSISLSAIDTSVRDNKKPTKKAVKKISKPKAKPKKTPTKPAVKKSAIKSTPTPKKAPSISNLFSEVKTAKITHKAKKKIKKIDTKRITHITKRINTTHVTKRSDAKKRLSELQLQESIQLASGMSQSRSPDVDKYLAKVHAFIYDNFHPSQQSANQSAKVRIWLTSSGTMSDFKVLVSSSDAMLNEEVAFLREKLSKMQFPLHPDNRATVIDIIVKAKE